MSTHKFDVICISETFDENDENLLLMKIWK